MFSLLIPCAKRPSDWRTDLAGDRELFSGFSPNSRHSPTMPARLCSYYYIIYFFVVEHQNSRIIKMKIDYHFLHAGTPKSVSPRKSRSRL
jgi:hypothetical protein